MARVTHHGEERLGERCGLSRKAQLKHAEAALREGFRQQDFAGGLRRYLDKVALKNPGTRPVVHGEHVFIFAGDSMVTVLHLPHEFRRAVDKARKRRKEGA